MFLPRSGNTAALGYVAIILLTWLPIPTPPDIVHRMVPGFLVEPTPKPPPSPYPMPLTHPTLTWVHLSTWKFPSS